MNVDFLLEDKEQGQITEKDWHLAYPKKERQKLVRLGDNNG
jgi:hypothetical protein